VSIVNTWELLSSVEPLFNRVRLASAGQSLFLGLFANAIPVLMLELAASEKISYTLLDHWSSILSTGGRLFKSQKGKTTDELATSAAA
jgi:hypothetical protein